MKPMFLAKRLTWDLSLRPFMLLLHQFDAVVGKIDFPQQLKPYTYKPLRTHWEKLPPRAFAAGDGKKIVCSIIQSDTLNTEQSHYTIWSGLKKKRHTNVPIHKLKQFTQWYHARVPVLKFNCFMYDKWNDTFSTICVM